MDIRRATPGDRDDVASLLRTLGLPALPSDVPLSNVLVALEDGTVIGVIALGVVARRGLIRAAAVHPDHQPDRVGASLLQSLIARAHELGLRELYRLAEDDDWFARAGFVSMPRDAVPDEIRATRPYREQVPAPATVMRLGLATRCV